MSYALKIALLLFYLTGLSLSAQALSGETEQYWKEANQALHSNKLDDALELYQKVLRSCERDRYAAGVVKSLEALALVHKKRGDYPQARHYCRRSIETGEPSFRAYAIFAQTAYEDGESYDEALKFCQEGRKRFPNEDFLISYCDLLENVRQKKVETATAVAGSHQLSRMEREVIRELNLARNAPIQYAAYLIELREYFSGVLLKQPDKIPVRTNEGVAAVDEAIQFLQRTSPISALKSSVGMSLAARDHVLDQQSSGQTGHSGGDGSEPFERLERYGAWDGISGENIAYGDETARMIVMQLIIDDGVPSRGHRENIFNREFRVAGVSIGTHPVYRTMCVITFARKFTGKDGS